MIDSPPAGRSSDVPAVVIAIGLSLGLLSAALHWSRGWSAVLPAGLATAATVWLLQIAGVLAIARVLRLQCRTGFGKIGVDFWIPFVAGLVAADLYVYSVTGRPAAFYLVILFNLDAQRWIGSGGFQHNLSLLIPAAVTVTVACISTRFLLSLFRHRLLSHRLLRRVTAVAVLALLAKPLLGRLPHPARDLPAGWQRSLVIDTDHAKGSVSQQDIVVFVVESLRGDALSLETMPIASQIADSGIRFQRHYSGANSSLPGLFALLDGSLASNAKSRLQAGHQLALLQNLRAAGYETWFVCGGDPGGYEAMDRLLSSSQFDQLITHKHADWWQGDRWAVAQVAKRVNVRQASTIDRPICAVVLLCGTHFAYEIPAEPRFQPAATDAELLVPWLPGDSQRTAVKNRYNSCVYQLDQLLGESLSRLVESGVVIAVTGDHGQALYDDGTIAHWSKLSDAQTRVPFMIAGKGVDAELIEFPTGHADAAAVLSSLATNQFRLPQPAPVLLVQSNPRDAFEDWVIIEPTRRTAWRRYPQQTVFLGEVDQYAKLIDTW